jgi:hypothetical protein
MYLSPNGGAATSYLTARMSESSRRRARALPISLGVRPKFQDLGREAENQ